MNIVFHVGLHKTASTWLQVEFFSKHPEVCVLNDFEFPWKDELVSYLVWTSCSSFDPIFYRHLVESRMERSKVNKKTVFVISAERLSGHPMSGGFDRENIIKNIRSAFPDGKILAVIREQQEVILSSYRQTVSEGETRSLREVLHQKLWKRPSFDIEFFNYRSLFNTYTNLFPESRVKFVLFETLQTDPKLFVADLIDFLGVCPFEPRLDRRANKTANYKVIEARRIVNRISKTEYVLSPLLNVGRGKTFKFLVWIIHWFVFKSCGQKHSELGFIRGHFRNSNDLFFSNIGVENRYKRTSGDP